jgi:hypothetical protein
MIRNTRALANINIPPRFAETIRVAPTDSERELYERISNLSRSMADTRKNRILLKLIRQAPGKKIIFVK